MMAPSQISAMASLQAQRTPKYTICARCATAASKSSYLKARGINIFNYPHNCRFVFRYDLAEIDLTHAIASDPHNIDFLVNRSQCYYETREFDSAVSSALAMLVTETKRVHS
jgi:hypothetical protein